MFQTSEWNVILVSHMSGFDRVCWIENHWSFITVGQVSFTSSIYNEPVQKSVHFTVQSTKYLCFCSFYSCFHIAFYVYVFLMFLQCPIRKISLHE